MVEAILVEWGFYNKKAIEKDYYLTKFEGSGLEKETNLKGTAHCKKEATEGCACEWGHISFQEVNYKPFGKDFDIRTCLQYLWLSHIAWNDKMGGNKHKGKIYISLGWYATDFYYTQNCWLWNKFIRVTH